jgi:hypothetical protein
MQISTDPVTGRQYTVDPATGQSRWLGQPDPPPPSVQAAQPMGYGTQPIGYSTQPTGHGTQPMPQGGPQQQWAPTGQRPTSRAAASPPAKKRTGLKILGGVVGVFVVLGIIGSLIGGGGDDVTTVSAAGSSSSGAVAAASGKASVSAKAAAAPKPEQIITVTAAKFGDEFDENQPAAEKKYNGKRVKVTKATINNIKTGRIMLNASSNEISLTQISCDLDDEEQALTLKKGQTVTVTGTVDGQLMGVIDLKECAVG